MDGIASGWREPRRTFDRLVPGQSFKPSCRLVASRVGAESNGGSPAFELSEEQKRQLIENAGRLLDGRFDLFDLEDLDVGPQINWNYDYSARKHTPTTKSSGIDYRDFETVGDCKLVWEPSRHQHLLVLARAFAVTGQAKYAEAVVGQIDNWLAQCPFPNGMNWRSPLELGIRLINWAWAFELIEPSGLLTQAWWQKIVPAIHRHLWCLDRGYSRYSSANNHLIGEAAGAYIGARYFGGFIQSDGWARRAKQILEEEIINQTHADGGNKEQALGYHVFVLEFFLLAGLAGRNSGDDFSKPYWTQIERMFEFVAVFVEGGGNVPLYGDYDDGFVLNLGDRDNQTRALLSVAGELFDRDDFRSLAGASRERVAWQLSIPASVRAKPTFQKPLQSKAFPDTGYYLLQSGGADVEDRISAVFDCAELGMGQLAAHGHADALSLTLRAFGHDVLVDPGTYDYFTHRKWRDYFKSTRAHNTITVDGTNQSEMLGLFLWGARAESKCVEWLPSSNGGSVSGQHDGYCRLSDPVSHRRSVALDVVACELSITDELSATAGHSAELCFHLSELCSVEDVCENSVIISAPFGRVTMSMDPRLNLTIYRGSEDPICGWMSRGYHRKVPCPTIVGRFQWEGSITLVTRVLLERQLKGELDRTEQSKTRSLPPQGSPSRREVIQRGV